MGLAAAAADAVRIGEGDSFVDARDVGSTATIALFRDGECAAAWTGVSSGQFVSEGFPSFPND